MRVSGREVANRILENLKLQIQRQNLKPGLAIILAGNHPASKLYVTNKLKAASEIDIKAQLFEFAEDQKVECLERVKKLNGDHGIHGIIVQYPVHDSWDYSEIANSVALEKDVDGFLEGSPFRGATALGVFEMLSEFARLEGFADTLEFLKSKKIVILGKGKTAGRPTIELLKDKGLEVTIIDSKTENPNEIIKSADVVISATGKKHILTGDNIRPGSYVIGVGVGKEEVDGAEKVFGDIDEEGIKDKARLYCPTIGGIGPLTIACLLRNVVQSAKTSP